MGQAAAAVSVAERLGIRLTPAATRALTNFRSLPVAGRGLLAVLGLWALALAGPRADPPGQSAQGSPSAAAAQSAPADNSRCYVCHANYDSEEETLTFVHARVGIGCVRCHGDSSPHSTDEDGLTPPDRMFPKSRIRFNCLGCHDWVKLVASDKTRADRADLQTKPDHQAVLAGTTSDKKFCTDCHGSEHRLSHRTRIWDKKTGQLLSRDATPRMLTEPASP